MYGELAAGLGFVAAPVPEPTLPPAAAPPPAGAGVAVGVVDVPRAPLKAAVVPGLPNVCVVAWELFWGVEKKFGSAGDEDDPPPPAPVPLASEPPATVVIPLAVVVVVVSAVELVVVGARTAAVLGVGGAGEVTTMTVVPRVEVDTVVPWVGVAPPETLGVGWTVPATELVPPPGTSWADALGPASARAAPRANGTRARRTFVARGCRFIRSERRRNRRSARFDETRSSVARPGRRRRRAGTDVAAAVRRREARVTRVQTGSASAAARAPGVSAAARASTVHGDNDVALRRARGLGALSDGVEQRLASRERRRARVAGSPRPPRS
jgi:hypothetical protein